MAKRILVTITFDAGLEPHYDLTRMAEHTLRQILHMIRLGEVPAIMEAAVVATTDIDSRETQHLAVEVPDDA